jgi:hypothetical protein
LRADKGIGVGPEIDPARMLDFDRGHILQEGFRMAAEVERPMEKAGLDERLLWRSASSVSS